MMLHAFKMPAALTACFVIAAACSPGSTTQVDAQTTDSDAPTQVAETTAPQASPVDLDLLALLATKIENPGATVTQTAPAARTESGWRIVPAKSASFQPEAPSRNTEPQVSNRPLPVVTPGTHRTVEYKN